jgi:DNA repair protein RecO (recombination protein O)
MLLRTEGIVLKTALYGEADLIVTYLTKDHGIMKAFAKSPRKTKSRFGSSLEPLTHARLSFWGREDAPLPRLTQSDIITPFETIRSRMKCFLRMAEVVELALTFIPERDADPRLYRLIVEVLNAAESDCETGVLVLAFKVKILDMAGYLPRLDRCGVCGGRGDEFYVMHGTVLCGRCSAGASSSLRLSGGAVRLHSTLLAWDIPKIGRIKPSAGLVQELTAVLDGHVRYVTDRTSRTQAFQAEIRSP